MKTASDKKKYAYQASTSSDYYYKTGFVEAENVSEAIDILKRRHFMEIKLWENLKGCEYKVVYPETEISENEEVKEMGEAQWVQ